MLLTEGSSDLNRENNEDKKWESVDKVPMVGSVAGRPQKTR